MFDKKTIKKVPPSVYANYEDLRKIEHKDITITGDVVAALQNCVTFALKHKGIDGIIRESTSDSVIDMLQLMSALSASTLKKSGQPIPKGAIIKGSDLIKGGR
jgi:sulfur transfer complex TusBCD TusB component (DsrH family)